jgi:hypothetical protein
MSILDDNKNRNVNLAVQLAGEDLARDRMVTIGSYNYTNITTATTTTVKSGSGYLNALIVNKGVTSATITLYDNTAGSGTLIGTITFGGSLLSDPPNEVPYNINFITGLTIVTSGATDLTVSWL